MRGQKAVRDGQRLVQLVGLTLENSQLADRLLSSSLAGSSGSSLHTTDPFTSFRAIVRAYTSVARRQGLQQVHSAGPAHPRQGSNDAQVHSLC